MNDPDEDRLIQHLADRLKRTFANLQPTLIETVVYAQWRQYDGSRIRDYVPILVERDAREILRALAVEAKPDGHDSTLVEVPRPTDTGAIPSPA